jgi:hypothetical protein
MLARIPFWGWLLVILTALYLVYNPLGVSLVHMWSSPNYMELLPFKILGTLLVVSLLGLVLHGTFSSTSWLGLTLMLTIMAVTLWSAHALIAFDVFALGFWSWALQPILAVILTLGWQWPKIWRRSTGAVSVSDPDTPA